MTSRELVISALNHQPVVRVPRDLWHSPGVEMSRADELAEIEIRFPKDIVPQEFKYPPGKRSRGKPYRAGRYTDAWGCTWHAAQPGRIGELRDPPLADPAGIAQYRPPFELLDTAKLVGVNRGCAATSRFVLAGTETRPFERLQLLRGAEATYCDLASASGRVRSLLAMLHDFFCREMEMWAGTDVDGVAFRDDWGSQDGLLIAPEMWRDLFRPLYRDYCEILHAQDKFAFFHSDGHIADIFGDLVEIGIDAINSQLFAMDVERLAEQFRGRVTFWGEIDRQHVLPFGSREEIRDAVRRVRRALDFGSGGVIAQCTWEPGVPMQNIAAVFGQWMLPLPMHA
jgi:uroporphyrinogen decarboxylase